MASFDPINYDPLEPVRTPRPPVRRGFVVTFAILCLAAGLVYGVPYILERAGYAWEAGRSARRPTCWRNWRRKGSSTTPRRCFEWRPSRSRRSGQHPHDRFRRNPRRRSRSRIRYRLGSRHRQKSRLYRHQSPRHPRCRHHRGSDRPQPADGGETRRRRPANRSGGDPSRRRLAGGRRMGRFGQGFGRRLGLGDRQSVHARPNRHRGHRLRDR